MQVQIQPAQIKKIHTLLSIAGIADPEYRALLSGRFGVSSCKHLSFAQAGEMIADIQHIARAKGIHTGRGTKFEQRPGMATPAQLRKIEAMWADVSYHTDPLLRSRALRMFLSNRFGISDLRFIPHNMPHKIIRTLTAMKGQNA